MESKNTDYEKITKIDGVSIFADKDGYFMWEHYPSSDGSYCAIPVRLGKTADEVEQALANDRDWNYRAWHGEMSEILEAQEAVHKLPFID
mgnify:CR=1 FL=1